MALFKVVEASFKMVAKSSGMVNSIKASVRLNHVRAFRSLPSRLFGIDTTFLTRPRCSASVNCSCNCSSAMAMHTKGDQELAEFLTEEIVAENKAQKFPNLPKLEGFQVATNGANITLTRKFNNENIKLTLNVNHTVDAEVSEGDININQDKVDMAEMKSKPSFIVEIEKNGKFLEFGCTVVDDGGPSNPDDQEAYNDVFNIDEIILHEGSKQDSTYAVSGEVMDGYLYDLLMNMLEERGVSNEFAHHLIDFSTSYEHKLYIGFLERMKSFVTAK